MRIKRLVVVSLILLLGLSGWKETKGEEAQKEVYVPKVIIEGKWGSGPGEFGIIPSEYEAPTGPKEFQIDLEENIYVLDAVNSRIQKFNSKGKLELIIEGEKGKLSGGQLIVDSKENLYLFSWYGIYRAKSRTTKLELVISGEDLREKKHFNYDPGWGIGFSLDEFDNLYVTDDIGKKYKVKNLERFDIELYGTSEKLRRGYISKAISRKSQKDEYTVNENENIDLLLIFNAKGEKVNEILVEPPKNFKDNFSHYASHVSIIDNQNNIYAYITGTLIDSSTGYPFVVFKYIYKWAPNGNLLAQIDLDSAPKILNFKQPYTSKPLINRDGKIYQLIWSQKKGLVVIKFEKK